MSDFSIIFNWLDFCGPLFACIVFWTVRHRIADDLKLVKWFCIIQLVCNSTAYLFDILNFRNYWIYELNMILSFLVLFWLFSRYLLDLRKSTSILLGLLVFTSIIVIYYFFGWDNTFNSYGMAICSMMIVAFSLYFFYTKLINSSEDVSIPNTSIFWCVVGLFTYYAGSFFIFISYKYIIDSDSSTAPTLWRFHNILLLICCLYISYGILCKNYRTILS